LDLSKVRLYKNDEEKRGCIGCMTALLPIGISIGVIAVYYSVLFANIEKITLMPGSAQATLMLGGIVVGATLLVVFIRKALKGYETPPAPLPPSVRLLTNYRARMKRPYLISGMCCASAVAISQRFAYSDFIHCFFWAILFIFLVDLRLGYKRARSLDRALTVLQFTGSPIHWQFAPELWQQWIEAEVARIAPQPAGRRARNLRKLLVAAACEAYFGEWGYSCAGSYASWSEFRCRLVSASIDTTLPRCIFFTFHKVEGHDSRNLRSFDEVQTVPIPPGGEADLAVLQWQLQSRCPEARVTLV